MTAAADIAAIDDNGANTAAEVRTALTSVLAVPPLTLAVDDPLTTTDDVTTYSGTWSINTYLQCVVATSTQCRALSDTNIGSAFTIIECEIEIPTGFTGSGQHIRIGEAESNSNQQIGFGLRGDGQSYFEADAVAALSTRAYTIPAAGTWVTLRLMQAGDGYDGYIDGVLHHSINNNQLNSVGPLFKPYLVAYSTSAMTVRFRNLKAWTMELPA